MYFLLDHFFFGVKSEVCQPGMFCFPLQLLTHIVRLPYPPKNKPTSPPPPPLFIKTLVYGHCRHGEDGSANED